MSPEIHKLVLLYIAMGLGVVITLAGVVLFFLGANAGASGAEFSIGKIKLKITKAGPGAIVTLFGVFLIALGLFFSPTKKVEETTTEVLEPQILESWLANTKKITGSEHYNAVIDKLVGNDMEDGQPVRKFRVEYLRLDNGRELGKLAQSIYGEPRFWPLVAAINLEKLKSWPAAEGTVIPSGTLLEIWRVSKYFGKTSRTIISISGPDVQAGYDEILKTAQSGKRFGREVSFDQMSDRFKQKELGLQYAPAKAPASISNIGELAIKYYGDKKYWPIIAWVNADSLAEGAGASTPIDQKQDLFVITIAP